MILLIDNYDSFTYNLFQYLSLHDVVKTVRNDKISIEEIERMRPDYIVISPGPKTPYEAGISMDVIKYFYNKIPILGVCLGHQCIGEVFNSKVIKAPDYIHGKTSIIKHHEKDLFKTIKNNIQVARYHSLAIDPDEISSELEITSQTIQGEIMSIRHRDYPVFGVQFHPESIMTEYGHEIIENFIKEGQSV